ncbi:MAG TPA: tRNA pseudouridine(38-40) synthase TruA [Kofleriaceae bacterium]|nr:tRNA pseudouridine(38-40) synthase TruA [Kofleriaceae bacterium]
MAAPRTIRLVVEYDGTNLCGWQRQDNGPTVQGHLEAALADLLGKHTAVAGASRTDAGVHALGQVARFVTDGTIPPRGIMRALNARLPPGIAIAEASEVEGDWHPRFSATGKHYRYMLWLRPERSAHWHNRTWHRALPVDVERMQEAAPHFVGVHDFAAFRAVGCVAKTTRRIMSEVSVTRDARTPDLCVIDVCGNAFLRNMVRIMVGTLVDIGEHRFAPSELPEIIAAGDRQRAGQTAPAQGLTLVSVRYDGVRGEHIGATQASAETV